MNFLAPFMFDSSNIQTRKIKMSSYFKALGIHLYLATTERSYIESGKYFVANEQAMIAHKKTLNNDYNSRVANCDSAFAVWNTLISLEEQNSNDMERESSEDDCDQECFMIQRNDPLEVNLESEINEDVNMLNDELAIFCEDLLEIYKL